MAAIEAGMEEWTKNTCITFKRRTNEEAYANFRLGSGWVLKMTENDNALKPAADWYTASKYSSLPFKKKKNRKLLKHIDPLLWYLMQQIPWSTYQ